MTWEIEESPILDRASWRSPSVPSLFSPTGPIAHCPWSSGSVLIAPRHYAPVNVPDGAGNPGRFLRQQKCNGYSNLFGATDTADWVETVDTLKYNVYLFLGYTTLQYCVLD